MSLDYDILVPTLVCQCGRKFAAPLIEVHPELKMNVSKMKLTCRACGSGVIIIDDNDVNIVSREHD